MTRAKPVRLMFGALTNSVYAVTDYAEKPHPTIPGETLLTARTKHDVTRDFYRVVFAFLESNTLTAPDGRTVEIVEPPQESIT